MPCSGVSDSSQTTAVSHLHLTVANDWDLSLPLIILSKARHLYILCEVCSDVSLFLRNRIHLWPWSIQWVHQQMMFYSNNKNKAQTPSCLYPSSLFSSNICEQLNLWFSRCTAWECAAVWSRPLEHHWMLRLSGLTLWPHAEMGRGCQTLLSSHL